MKKTRSEEKLERDDNEKKRQQRLAEKNKKNHGIRSVNSRISRMNDWKPEYHRVKENIIKLTNRFSDLEPTVEMTTGFKDDHEVEFFSIKNGSVAVTSGTKISFEKKDMTNAEFDSIIDEHNREVDALQTKLLISTKNEEFHKKHKKTTTDKLHHLEKHNQIILGMKVELSHLEDENKKQDLLLGSMIDMIKRRKKRIVTGETLCETVFLTTLNLVGMDGREALRRMKVVLAEKFGLINDDDDN